MAIVVLKLPIWMARQIWRRKQLLWPRKSSMLLGSFERSDRNSVWFQHDFNMNWVWWFGSYPSIRSGCSTWTGFGGLVPPISSNFLLSIIHLSLVSIRLHRCLCFRMRLGTVGGLGLDARPVFCVKRPTETCTPLKAHCATWKNWTETWRFLEDDFHVHMS